MNEGLAIIKQTGKYDEIYDKWFGVVAPRDVSTGTIVKYTIIAVVPVILVLLMLALWSWSLKREVNNRTLKFQHETAGAYESRSGAYRK